MIDRGAGIPLYQQVYRGLRDQILRGELPTGGRLPSSRTLALELNVSRNVTLLAYDQLQADGLILTRQGSGTTVAGGGPPAWQVPLPGEIAAGQRPAPGGPEPNTHASGELPYGRRPLLVDFRSGLPACEAFPRSLWSRLWTQALDRAPDDFLGYGPVAGALPLRESLARYLGQARGVSTAPENVVLTSGATQALSILADSVLRKGDVAICENPGHPVVRSIFERRGARVQTVPVDDHGIQVDELARVISSLAAGPRLIYITPSHQFPTGAVLDLSRRHALTAIARTTGAFVVEDDYDSEIRHKAAPLPALQGLCPERVVYIGTFSKVLAPALRIGYAVLPPVLTDAFCQAKFLADYHSPGIDQLALAEFVSGGHLQRHLARMRRIYRQKRAVLVSAVTEAFGARARCRGDETGLHLWLDLDSHWSGKHLAEAAAQQGVGVYPLSDCWDPNLPMPARCHLVLGYGALDEAAIRRGIRLLADIERNQK